MTQSSEWHLPDRWPCGCENYADHYKAHLGCITMCAPTSRRNSSGARYRCNIRCDHPLHLHGDEPLLFHQWQKVTLDGEICTVIQYVRTADGVLYTCDQKDWASRLLISEHRLASLEIPQLII